MSTTKNKNYEHVQTDQGINGQYKTWFLDYASYVILERAVPPVEDGLKPVQRRILHAMKEMDDGRYNKVANIIGQTMQYHPHGDASIGDALVNMGQKDLLIDTQGNWGDVRTGDDAAAARYIEGRLSKFALEVVFNPKTTTWQLSYDGRKNEPVTLPMKFPLLLAQGADGIAVGLSTKILPHNFHELLEASIKHLKGKKFELYPDFQTGGMHQGTASEAMLGTYVQLNVNAETDMMVGAYYRFKDAIAPFVGFDYKNFIVGISYDANTSKLGAMSRNVNSFELSLSYVKRSGTRSIFDFVRCARL